MNRDLKDREKNLKTFTVIATDDAVRDGHAPSGKMKMNFAKLRRAHASLNAELNLANAELQRRFGERVFIADVAGDGLCVMIEKSNTPTGVTLDEFEKIIARSKDIDLWAIETSL